MEAIVGHSNNHSASVCIDGLGFQYLKGMLAAEGLYSAEFGGLWLGGNYAGRNWMLGAPSAQVIRNLVVKLDDYVLASN
jgi:hypothetical protein